MSVCIRTITNKLSLPFVGAGKPVSPVDRHLTRSVRKTTAFLDEFFAPGTNVKNDSRENSANFFVKPLERTHEDVVRNYKIRRENNWCVRNDAAQRIRDIAERRGNGNVTGEKVETILSVAEENRAVGTSGDSKMQSKETAPGRPTQQQLEHVYNILREDLPKFFIKPIDYKIYHQNIVFENNIRGTVTTGIYEYVKQTAMLRIIGHLRFAYVKFQVLKMTVHPEDDTIKVRWRILGIAGTKILLTFWRYRLWNIKKTIDHLDSWHDGFSTFYICGDGTVIKHVADKMMPDQDTEVTTKDKTGMAAKLALFLGLVTPREFIADISPLVSFNRNPKPIETACKKTLDSPTQRIP